MFRASLLVALLLTTTVAAQEDACSQTDPCEWVVTVDSTGFDRDGQEELFYNATLGDWYRFSFLNADDVDHTISLEDHDAWTVTADAIFLDTDPFELDQAGSFALTDEQTGDTAIVQVLVGDVVDAEAGSDPASQSGPGEDGGKTTPGFGLVAALVALALVRRR